ncbi:MAG: hypothetical protein AABX84_00510 [Nanoarchaeota archaeon]
MEVGQIVEVENFGRMLVNHIGRNTVLIGRGISTPTIAKIFSIEINPEQINEDSSGRISLTEPYEISKTFDYGRERLNFGSLNDYLNSRGLKWQRE